MSFPVYLRIGSFCVHPHLFFETLAYLIGFRVFQTLRRIQGDVLNDFYRWWMLAAASIGAVAGSRLLSVLETPHLFLGRLSQPSLLFSGRTIVGALIGGLFAVEFAKRRLGITTRTGDLVALPLCAGIAIGRVGCFLTGKDDQTAGTATVLPWGVDFGDGIARHPTQLYEVLFVLSLGAVILLVSRRPHLPGDLFKIFMVGYFAFRLCCDFLKPEVRVFAGLSSIQLACVAMLVYYSLDIRRWIADRQSAHRSRAPGDVRSPDNPDLLAPGNNASLRASELDRNLSPLQVPPDPLQPSARWFSTRLPVNQIRRRKEL